MEESCTHASITFGWAVTSFFKSFMVVSVYSSNKIQMSTIPFKEISQRWERKWFLFLFPFKHLSYAEYNSLLHVLFDEMFGLVNDV